MFNTFVSEHHHFLQSEPNASGHHDFLQAEPKKKQKIVHLHFVSSDEESSSDEENPIDGETKSHGGYSPQGLDIIKSGHTLKENRKGTPENEFVAPQQLIDSVKKWPIKKVFGCGKKRWSVDTIHEYHRLFPSTGQTLEQRCYYPEYVPEPQKYIDFCNSLEGLRKKRTPIIIKGKKPAFLERDTMWYSCVDATGFSTVYRGGTRDYNIPMNVEEHQFKMDADFAQILPSVKDLLQRIFTDFRERPNHCVITRYNRTYDKINSHTDKTKDLVRGSSVFIFTFGAEKTFRVVHQRRMRKKDDNPKHYKDPIYKKNTVADLKPVSGSLIRMTWDMNQIFEHGIPVPNKMKKPDGKDKKFQAERETTKEYHVEPRYSITFRSKCTWYQPDTRETYVDPDCQFSSLQEGGAQRVILDDNVCSNVEPKFQNSEDKYDVMKLPVLKKEAERKGIIPEGNNVMMKQASLTRFEAAEPKRSHSEQKPRGTAKRRRRNVSHKVDHQRDSSVHNVRELRNRVDAIRKGWFTGESKRNNKGYSPSEHDKIKFNINLYLGQCLEFFMEDTTETSAIVLDSEDLGSSATLAAFGVQPKHIYVPNYFEKNTEYTTMKANLPELASFPVSLEGFLTALEDSKNEPDFHKKLRSEWKSTHYSTRPYLIEPLPMRFEHLDFAYLDYCGMFMNSARPNNADTVDAMFAKHVFPKDSAFILAITGSLHAISIKDLNKELDRYKSAVVESATRNGYRLKEDQFFVYNRSHQEGGVDESLAHRKENFDDIPEDVHFKKQSHSSKMFFMSFIGNGEQQTLDEWDELFDTTCPNGLCKVQFGHRECLYQRGFINKERVVLTKPFCNYRITNLYFWDTSFDNYTTTIGKFDAVPMFDEEEDDEEDDEEDPKTDAEYLEEYNQIKKYRKLPEGILTTFKVIKSTKRKDGTIGEIIDMTKLIEQVRVARNGRGEGYQIERGGHALTLDSVYDIETSIVSGKVSIECILGDVVGIHFTESDHIDIPGVENILSSAFLIQIDDFCGMLVHAKKGASDNDDDSSDSSDDDENEVESEGKSEEESEEPPRPSRKRPSRKRTQNVPLNIGGTKGKTY